MRLREPVAVAHDEARALAWFTFPGQVHVDVAGLEELGAQEHLESLLAHEVGHHVLPPGTPLAGHKVRYQMARATYVSAGGWHPKLEKIADTLANLFEDALVNTKIVELQRKRSSDPYPPLARLVRATNKGAQTEAGPVRAAAWWAVLRMDEMLWSLPSGWLAGRVYARPRPAAEPGEGASERERLAHELRQARAVPPEVVARLLAKVLQSHRADPVGGALPFGMLLAPLLLDMYEDSDDEEAQTAPGCGHAVPGPTQAEIDLMLGDPRLSEEPAHPLDELAERRAVEEGKSPARRRPGGQGFGIAETLRLLKPADRGFAIRSWYRNLAARWVSPMLQSAPAPPEACEGIPGALSAWELGDELDEIDWPGTFASGPAVVVGVTTRRREEIPDVPPPRLRRVELDLYVDSSGSMPGPASGAPSILAGTILVLSALRGGGTVRVTSFAGPGQVAGCESTRNPDEALRGLTAYFGGGTAFPLDLYEERYLRGPAGSPEGRHVVVLSDDGLCSMFGCEQPGREHVAGAVRARLDTATLLLIDPGPHSTGMAESAGYQVVGLRSMDDAPAACQRLARTLLLPREERAALADRKKGHG